MELLIFVLPIFYAAILWWFTTGLIMAVYGRARYIIQGWFVLATLVMAGAVGGLLVTARMVQPSSVYLAFTCGVIVWGWLMAAYYLGFVTGPSPDIEQTVTPVDPTHHSLGQRFRQALRASLHHELLVLAVGLLLAAVLLPNPNRWGFWSFLLLWLMHSSAKLNVFFGVRNFRVDFLPSHLHYLDRLITKRSSNPFFPLSICLASSASLALFYQVIAPTATEEQVIGSLLLVTMLVLGTIEHWLLIVPLPAMLWGWGVRTLPPTDVPEFTLAEIPLSGWPFAKLLMTKLRKSAMHPSIDELPLHSVAGERQCATVRALAKQVMES